MTAKTLGEAFFDGWRVRVRCAQGKRSGMKSIRECLHEAELDMGSLTWTRGLDFPIAMLAERLQCPRCKSRRVSVLFFPPSGHEARRAGVADEARDVRDPIGRVEQRDASGRVESVLAVASSMVVAQAAFDAATKSHSVAFGGAIVLLKDSEVVAKHSRHDDAIRSSPVAAK